MRVVQATGARDPIVALPLHFVSSPILISLLSTWATRAMPAPIKSSAAALFHGMCTAWCADGRFVMQSETAVALMVNQSLRENHDLKQPLVVNVVGCVADMTELSKASPLLNITWRARPSCDNKSGS